MIQTLRLLLQRVREAGLRLQLKKCTWFSKKITWLGFDISSEGVQIPEKLKEELLEEKPPLTPASLVGKTPLLQAAHFGTLSLQCKTP